MLFVYDKVSSTEYTMIDTSTMSKQTVHVSELLNKISNGIYIAGVIWTADANLDACLKKLCRPEYGTFYKHKIKGYSKYTLLVARLKTSNIRYIAGLQNNQFILSDNTLVSNDVLYDMVYNDLEIIGGVDSFDFDKKEIHASIFLDLDKVRNLYCSGLNVKDLKRYEPRGKLPLYDVFNIGFTNAGALVNIDDIDRVTNDSHLIVVKYDDAFVCKNFYKDVALEERYTLAELLKLAEKGYPVYGFSVKDNKDTCSLEFGTMLNKAIMYYSCSNIKLNSYGSMLRITMQDSERRVLFTSDKFAFVDSPFYLTIKDGRIIKTNIFSTQESVMQDFNKHNTEIQINIIGITDKYDNKDLGYNALALELTETYSYFTKDGSTEKTVTFSHVLYNYRTNEIKQYWYKTKEDAIPLKAEYDNNLR